jgi:hypothetical protein
MFAEHRITFYRILPIECNRYYATPTVIANPWCSINRFLRISLLKHVCQTRNRRVQHFGFYECDCTILCIAFRANNTPVNYVTLSQHYSITPITRKLLYTPTKSRLYWKTTLVCTAKLVSTTHPLPDRF